MFDQGFSDGLPLVPPTPERVVRMFSGTRRPQEVVAAVPPNMAPATVEKIAINAVMAGCRPEYLPVVIAAVEAVCTDEFNIHGVTATTMGAAPVMVVNGPIRHRIGMNMKLSALGAGSRANATIGRAVRLAVRNMGGARPGGADRRHWAVPSNSRCALRNGGAQALASAPRGARISARGLRRHRVRHDQRSRPDGRSGLERG